MSFRPEPPTKKKSSSSPSFTYIPDEITENCLARISRSHYTRLSLVSKTFKSLLSSTELYAARSHLSNIESCLYVCLCDLNTQFSQWFTLWINPNQTLPKSSKTRKVGKLLVSITSPNVPSITDYTSTVAVVGSEIYVIGGLVDKAPSSSVRILDCRFHTWRDGPNMNVARYRSVSCVYDGKIYVVGGYKRLYANVFDPKTQTLERLPNPSIERRGNFRSSFVESQGKIYFRNFGKTVAYDPKQGEWECFENNSALYDKFECVVENVLYRYGTNDKFILEWFDIKDVKWKGVKGLDSLIHKFKQVFIDVTKLVSFGGKLLLIWEGSMKHNDMKDIWCAQIMFEKRDGGEVWGNVEWVDVVQTVPGSCKLVHCLAVSL